MPCRYEWMNGELYPELCVNMYIQNKWAFNLFVCFVLPIIIIMKTICLHLWINKAYYILLWTKTKDLLVRGLTFILGNSSKGLGLCFEVRTGISGWYQSSYTKSGSCSARVMSHLPRTSRCPWPARLGHQLFPATHLLLHLTLLCLVAQKMVASCNFFALWSNSPSYQTPSHWSVPCFPYTTFPIFPITSPVVFTYFTISWC